MLDPFTLPFVQRGIVEVAVLALAAGLIGTWIVLRGLAFFSHAVGTAAFPGLVLADGLGFSAHLGAAGTAALVAAAVGWLARHERERYDSLTALVLVAALALGVVLASDVFHSGSNVETLLFGSLLTIDGGDIAWAAGAGAVVLAATYAVGPRWTATGFDPGAARALGLRSSLPDMALLGLVALVAVAALSAVGALLATALLVVPAATARLLCDRLRTWQLATVALTAVEGVLGLWLSVQLNAPPGPAIAVLSGGVFAVVAVARSLGVRRAAALAAAGALAVLAGCGDQTAGPSNGVRVVATTTQLGDFARPPGIQVIGALLPSQTTQAQPSAGDVAQLSRLIRRERVNAVFPESSLNPKLADAIARQTGARSDLTLYGDTLGPSGSDGETYLGMERHNADAMVRGFTRGARGCPIPAL